MKELGVAIDNELSREASINKVKFKEKDISLFLSCLNIFVFDKSNPIIEFASY